jgi:hypothetical protein
MGIPADPDAGNVSSKGGVAVKRSPDRSNPPILEELPKLKVPTIRFHPAYLKRGAKDAKP